MYEEILYQVSMKKSCIKCIKKSCIKCMKKSCIKWVWRNLVSSVLRNLVSSVWRNLVSSEYEEILYQVGMKKSCDQDAARVMGLISWSPTVKSPIPRSRAWLHMKTHNGMTFFSYATSVMSLSRRHGMVCFSKGPAPECQEAGVSIYFKHFDKSSRFSWWHPYRS